MVEEPEVHRHAAQKKNFTLRLARCFAPARQLAESVDRSFAGSLYSLTQSVSRPVRQSVGHSEATACKNRLDNLEGQKFDPFDSGWI